MATAQGAWLTTARGNFAMNRESRALLWQALAYYTGQDSVAPVDSEALQTTLLQAGALECETHTVAVVEPAAPISIYGSSAFMRRLTGALAKRGLTHRSGTGGGVAAIEWNANDTTIARRLCNCYRRGVPHWVLAALGERILMARIEPGRSACWDCLLRRLGLPPGPPNEVTALPDSAIEALADNLWIEKQFSTVAVEHCVMIEANGPPSLHIGLPVPDCPRCADVLGRPLKGPSTLRDALVPPELLALADRELGILRELLIYQPADPRLPVLPVCASARLALPTAHGESRRIRGEGKGASRDEAVISAIGEGIERYAASSWDPAALFRMAFDKDPTALFDPRDLSLYGMQQYETPGFPYPRFDPRQPLCWAKGKWLDTGAALGVPAIAVYLDFPTPPRECLAQTTSNGLATGRGVADATLRALYELIERDAFMRAWMTDDAPVWRLSSQGIGPDAEAALNSLASERVQIELYLLGDHSRHATVLCIGWGDGNRWPGVTMGLGTHASLDVALRKAVFEHSHYGLYMQRLMREGRHRAVVAPNDVRSNLDHGLLYVHPAWQGPVREMTAGASFLPLDRARLRFTQPATLEACVSALNAAGIRAAAVDVTPADIAMTPYRVVRAVASGLQPIHFGYGMQRCGHARLDWNARAALPHPIA